jgi:hypothetical protein
MDGPFPLLSHSFIRSHRPWPPATRQKKTGLTQRRQTGLMGADKFRQTEKLVPHPQLATAFGFLI